MKTIKIQHMLKSLYLTLSTSKPVQRLRLTEWIFFSKL